MYLKKSTIDRIAYAVLLLHAIITYTSVQQEMGLDAITSLLFLVVDIAVFSCIYEAIMDILTGEPMKRFEAFLDLILQKRKARTSAVQAETVIPVQILALPVPYAQDTYVQGPVLEAIVIDDINVDTCAEPEIITEAIAEDIQEDITEQVSDTVSPSVNPSVSDRALRKQERMIKELYDFFLSQAIEEEDEVISINDIFNEKERDALLYNIRELVTKKKPEFKTVIEGKKDELTKCDFYHLFHAIGFHAGKEKPGRAISVMIKKSIPEYTKGLQPGTIYAKMTNTEDPHKIPVFDKDKDLPTSPDFADDIS